MQLENDYKNTLIRKVIIVSSTESSWLVEKNEATLTKITLSAEMNQ